MRVNDVMSTNVLTVNSREPLERARSTMNTRRVHHLVVVDGNKVVGLVTAELLAWGEAAGIARVEDVMFRHVVSGTPDLTIQKAANLLRGRTAGALPIRARAPGRHCDHLRPPGRSRSGSRAAGAGIAPMDAEGSRQEASRRHCGRAREVSTSSRRISGNGWARNRTEKKESDDEERDWPIAARAVDRRADSVARRRDARHCAAGPGSPPTSTPASRAAFVCPSPSATV